MNVYVFGNEDIKEDNFAFKVMNKLKSKIDNIKFIIVNLNEDLPFVNEKSIVILDTILGINEINIFDEKVLDKIFLSPRTSVHDFDLGFQLKYLKKLGKLNKITIVGLPQNKRLNYNLIQSIFKKLVAQDIQGS